LFGSGQYNCENDGGVVVWSRMKMRETGREEENMGRVVANVLIRNLFDPEKALECAALVDTGAAYMVLAKS
jgi:hypothetical protein